MRVTVRYRGREGMPVVGVLADDARGRIFFEYDAEWRRGGLELSPFMLPLETMGVVRSGDVGFSGLYGLFDDSLPDWWGERVMRYYFEEMNMAWSGVGLLEKLACQGAYGLGALAYEPDLAPRSFRESIVTEVVDMVDSARHLFRGESGVIVPGLVRGGLSPGGAQPKALVAFDEDFKIVMAGGGEVPEGFSRWLMKFQMDAEDSLCRQEYGIGLMAGEAGLRVPDVRLYEVGGAAHFLSRRFDVDGGGARHFHSYAGLTHTAVREMIDYVDLMDVARLLTAREVEVEEMYRRAVFNVGIGNDDDHPRNHGFLMDGKGEWNLSPAYDMTRTGYALGSGYRAAGVMGRYAKIGVAELRKLGEEQGLRGVDEMIGRVVDTARRWPEYAERAGLREVEAKVLWDEMPGRRW